MARKKCEACSGRGYLLVENDVHGVRIERCDACGRFKSDAAAHEHVFKAMSRKQPEKTETAGVYLELFHGRKTAREHMDDWGELGPVFGPLDYVHTTYGNDIKFNGKDSGNGWLTVKNGLIYYDDMFYGDWSVFSQLNENSAARLVKFDQKKADVPIKSKGKRK